MFWARVRSAPAALGKLAATNRLAAGSLEFTPKVIEGAATWSTRAKLVWVKEPPKLMLCAPRVQVRVSLKFQSGALRTVAVALVVALEMPAAPMPRSKPA